MKHQSWVEKLYKNEKGEVALVSMPNPPLILWFCALILSKLFNSGAAHDVFGLISFGALFTWSWLEVVDGACYLRRFLGLLILILTIKAHLS